MNFRSCFQTLQGRLTDLRSGVRDITTFTVTLIRVEMVVIIARIYAVLTVKIDAMTQAKITRILLKRLGQYF